MKNFRDYSQGMSILKRLYPVEVFALLQFNVDVNTDLKDDYECSKTH
jgi:hypothetical protein